MQIPWKLHPELSSESCHTSEQLFFHLLLALDFQLKYQQLHYNDATLIQDICQEDQFQYIVIILLLKFCHEMERVIKTALQYTFIFQKVNNLISKE